MFFTLRGDAYQGWVTGASTGSTRKSVSAKVVTEPAITLPPKELLDQFDDVVVPIRTLLTTLVDGSSRLGEIRDRLLPKLVTGQIDVSDLDLDGLVEGAGS